MTERFSSEARRNYVRPPEPEERVAKESDPVYVQSKTTNYRSAFVSFDMKVKFPHGYETRTFSRTYSFKEFMAKIPFKMARILCKKDPKEYTIIGPVEKENLALKEKVDSFNKTLYSAQKSSKEACSCRICGKEAKNQFGLMAHIRSAHPDDYLEEKKKLKEERELKQ